MSSPAIKYTREPNAASDPWSGRPLWDLESWDVSQSFGSPRPDAVPGNATRDYGYVDHRGVQHTVYRRASAVRS